MSKRGPEEHSKYNAETLAHNIILLRTAILSMHRTDLPIRETCKIIQETIAIIQAMSGMGLDPVDNTGSMENMVRVRARFEGRIKTY